MNRLEQSQELRTARRPRCGRQTVRPVERQKLHPRRTRQCPPRPLHASPCCRPLQSRPQSQIPAAYHRRETSKGRVTAVIRKLVITANALLKADRLWIKNSPLIITDSLGGELAVLQAPMLDGLLDPFTLDDGSPPPPEVGVGGRHVVQALVERWWL